MRILLTSDCYTPTINGVVTSTVNLRKELIGMGHEVLVLTLSTDSHTHEEDGILYLGSFDIGRIYPEARFRIGSSSRYLEELRRWGPDVIHSQTEFSTYHLAAKLASQLRVPHIHSCHTAYEDYTHYFFPSREAGKRIVGAWMRRISHQVDCMIAPTEKIETLLSWYGTGCPTEVIPSGIELDRYQAGQGNRERMRESYGYHDDDLLFVYVGRLAEEKGLQEIVSFLSKQDDPKVKLLIVGDGPYREELETLTEKTGMADRVTFTGMVKPAEVPAYYHMGDIFCSASISETQGLTYIEAMASGLPLLCRWDRCLEPLLEQGVNGWSYHDEREFSRCLDEILANRDALPEMGRQAARVSGNYGTEEFARKAAALYTKMVEQRGQYCHAEELAV